MVELLILRAKRNTLRRIFKMDDIAIKVEGVSKEFKLPHEKNSSIKSSAINVFSKKKGYELQKALSDISFEVKKGEFFGIVGRNGSGKSTLLKLLAGIYAPTEGTIQVNGSLTPFIELGVGFNPELTGRENVYLNGALLGFNRKDMRAMYADIVKFAELEKFMDQKLKNYSSGMQVRLAFSIAIRANTRILLLDEVLAVGDIIFQRKCYEYFKQLKRENKTVILVSHDVSILREYCSRGVLIEGGDLVADGSIDQVINKYIDLMNRHEEQKKAENGQINKGTNSWGSKDMVVHSAVVASTTGKQKSIFTGEDSDIQVSIEYAARKYCEKPVYGIVITDSSGQRIFESNTLWADVESKDMQSKSKIKIEWTVPNIFNDGTFFVSPAVADRQGTTIHNWVDNMVSFKVRKKTKSSAIVSVHHKLQIKDIKDDKK